MAELGTGVIEFGAPPGNNPKASNSKKHKYLLYNTMKIYRPVKLHERVSSLYPPRVAQWAFDDHVVFDPTLICDPFDQAMQQFSQPSIKSL